MDVKCVMSINKHYDHVQASCVIAPHLQSVSVLSPGSLTATEEEEEVSHCDENISLIQLQF